MTSVLNVDTIADKAGTGPVALTKQSAAKAWVLGSTAAALTKSVNIASGTDNGTGDYTYAFTNSMDSANFVVGNSIAQSNTGSSHNDSRTSSNYRVSYTDAAFGRADRVNNSSVHGDLA